MQGLDLLKNDGLLAVNVPESPAREKTVVVLGVARGGTTMVAGVLQALGVPMGEKLGTVLEDVVLSEAVETRNLESLQRIVGQRNADFPIWGWKRPSAVEFSDVWQGRLRNPYIIAIFRDPFAISNRNRISMLSDVFPNMERSVQHLDLLVKCLRQQKGPVLLCSYEKVLAAPESFVRAVDTFLGLNVPELWSEAISQIDPSPQAYLETSRITHSAGHLDAVTDRYCGGWAFYPKQPKQVAKVQIRLNGALVHTIEARLPRSDVKAQGLHPTGLCGFKFDWPKSILPQVGDQVDARVVGDVKALNGSPRPIVAVANPLSDTNSEGGALPAFYCIGAQKAGTTWLYAALKGHPQLNLPACKEVHYWDALKDRDLRWYRNHFKPGKINGDITPAYAILSKPVVRKVQALTPQAKLIFSMRHPVERAWSFVQMELARKFTTSPAELKAGAPQGEVLAFIRDRLFHPQCLARSNYAETIRSWREVFGDEALLLFRYERISSDPHGLIADICRHVGADPAWVDELAPEILEQTVFASEKIPFPPALRDEFSKLCAPFIDDLEQLLGEDFGAWKE